MNRLPMKIKDGSSIPSWPGLGVRVIAPSSNSPSTPLPKEGVKLRAKTRGADQLTVSESGFDRESIHRIGRRFSCRKRAFARTDNPTITSAKIADTISTDMNIP